MIKQVCTQIYSGGIAYDVWDKDAHAGVLSAMTDVETISAALNTHVNNTEVHIQDSEREYWNSKVDVNTLTSAISSKADNTYVDAHINDVHVHIQDSEREYWNTISAKWEEKDLTSAHSAFNPYITIEDSRTYIISATIESDTTAYVSAVENNSFIDFGTIPDSVESISLNVLASEIDGKNLVPQFASNVKTTSSSNLTQITLQYNGQTLPAYQMPEAFANSNLQISLYGLAYIIGQIDLEEMN